MARYQASFTSTAALAADAAIVALSPGAAVGFRLRRVTLGVVAGATTPTSQQIVVGINRGTARGTASTTVAGVAMDPRAAASGITGLDVAWSVQPTFGAATTDTFKAAFNSQSGVDLPWELMEEFQSNILAANVVVLVNRENAMPASHKFVVAVEWEE